MDEIYMEEALKEARKGALIGEVPIGAVIVKDNEIIGRGYNRREIDKDPTAHAEMIAIREASKNLGGWRLIGCSMYVTVEPCPMCAGAIMLSRIDNLIIGTMDPKGGACGSIINTPEDERYNHVTRVTRGVLKNECSQIMKHFFKELRRKKKKA
ncbi:MAG: tRNA adenosine(34) deaminase TadA [Anaeromicrobium sp.]|uniref:tRNA adenosine(34) deaminase TadA n=1 Tax=Anaeromicrobium sp. TaxID=1929132 RepID=UPI0025F44149|nr:tRNA adenosine(34) deaminase TadA [Anaeromicrobium sp.]MCT4592931.1 tRNA adenosine(34) deaminase TadA [Anaeromicrobium sp.]